MLGLPILPVGSDAPVAPPHGTYRYVMGVKFKKINLTIRIGIFKVKERRGRRSLQFSNKKVGQTKVDSIPKDGPRSHSDSRESIAHKIYSVNSNFLFPKIPDLQARNFLGKRKRNERKISSWFGPYSDRRA